MTGYLAPRAERESVTHIRAHNGARALRQRVTEYESNVVAMLQRPEWQQHAACRGVGPDKSHPDSPRQDRRGGYTLASQTFIATYCDRCDVKAECLAHVLKNDEKIGIWGGMTPTARGRLRNGQTLGKRESQAACGTAAGYQRHYRRGEKACLECIQAHTAASRRYEDAARLRRLAERRAAQ